MEMGLVQVNSGDKLKSFVILMHSRVMHQLQQKVINNNKLDYK